MTRVRDIPPGWVKLGVAVVAMLGAVIPVAVVSCQNQSPPPTRSEIITDVVRGVGNDQSERIRQEQRAACVAALRAMPIQVLRDISPADLRDGVVACASPFRPPKAPP